MRRFSFTEILTIILVAIAGIAILIGLYVWTRYLTAEKEEETLRSALQEVVDTKGEKALFEMAGIPVDQIYYGDELLSLYDSDNGSWNYTSEEARRIAVYNKCRDSVVEINAYSSLSDSGQGSGVILTSDGYIVTNKHVVGSSTSFTVVFSDNTSEEATVVGVDSLTDIAVLKVERTGLQAMDFGSAENLSVGQIVYTIGNPYGYSWSFTDGSISGLNRMVSTSSSSAVIPNMIQTNALVNPGNSGGPLLNSSGEMIGLISSIYSTSGSAEGISFALPVETVLDVADSLIKNGKVTRGWMDFLSVELNAQIVSYCGLVVDEGILVSQVVPAGKADRGGIKGGSEKAQYGSSVIYLGGDVIVAINDTPITGYTDYFAFLFNTKAGDKVNVTVIRNGERKTLENIELVEQTEENTQWILR
jgi:S1-C subfamily serine protease